MGNLLKTLTASALSVAVLATSGCVTNFNINDDKYRIPESEVTKIEKKYDEHLDSYSEAINTMRLTGLVNRFRDGLSYNDPNGGLIKAKGRNALERAGTFAAYSLAGGPFAIEAAGAFLPDRDEPILHAPFFFGYYPESIATQENFGETYNIYFKDVSDRLVQVLTDMGMTVSNNHQSQLKAERTIDGKQQTCEINLSFEYTRWKKNKPLRWAFKTHLPAWMKDRDDNQYWAVGIYPTTTIYADEFSFDFGSEEANAQAKIEVMKRYSELLPAHQFVYVPRIETKDGTIVKPEHIGTNKGDLFFIAPDDVIAKRKSAMKESSQKK